MFNQKISSVVVFRLKVEFSTKAKEQLIADIGSCLDSEKKTLSELVAVLKNNRSVPKHLNPKLIYLFMNELVSKNTDFSEYGYRSKRIKLEHQPIKIKSQEHLEELLKLPGIVADKCRPIGSNVLLPIYGLSSKGFGLPKAGGYGNMSGTYHESI